MSRSQLQSSQAQKRYPVDAFKHEFDLLEVGVEFYHQGMLFVELLVPGIVQREDAISNLVENIFLRKQILKLFLGQVVQIVRWVQQLIRFELRLHLNGVLLLESLLVLVARTAAFLSRWLL